MMKLLKLPARPALRYLNAPLPSIQGSGLQRQALKALLRINEQDEIFGVFGRNYTLFILYDLCAMGTGPTAPKPPLPSQRTHTSFISQAL